jgi:hypothetical protein
MNYDWTGKKAERQAQNRTLFMAVAITIVAVSIYIF